MPLTFTPATPAELDTVLSLAHSASSAPYSHWDADYPNREILSEDIAHGELYLLRENGTLREDGEGSVEFFTSGDEDVFLPLMRRLFAAR